MAINDRTDDMIALVRDSEDDFVQALTSYVWNYYRNYTGASRLEFDVVQAMQTLLDEAFPGAMSAEELVARAEREINDYGGVLGTGDGDTRAHRVCTFPEFDFGED